MIKKNELLVLLDRFVVCLEVSSNSFKKMVDFSVGNLASINRSVERERLELRNLELESKLAELSIENLRKEMAAEDSLRNPDVRDNAFK